MKKIYNLEYVDDTDGYEISVIEDKLFASKEGALKRSEEIKKSLVEEGYKIQAHRPDQLIGRQVSSWNGYISHEDEEIYVRCVVKELDIED